MSITNNEKEAIDIVLEMIDKRINVLMKSRPETNEKIKKFENAKSCVSDLEYLDLQ